MELPAGGCCCGTHLPSLRTHTGTYNHSFVHISSKTEISLIYLLQILVSPSILRYQIHCSDSKLGHWWNMQLYRSCSLRQRNIRDFSGVSNHFTTECPAIINRSLTFSLMPWTEDLLDLRERTVMNCDGSIQLIVSILGNLCPYWYLILVWIVILYDDGIVKVFWDVDVSLNQLNVK